LKVETLKKCQLPLHVSFPYTDVSYNLDTRVSNLLLTSNWIRYAR
jgi:hypothetical protein